MRRLSLTSKSSHKDERRPSKANDERHSSGLTESESEMRRARENSNGSKSSRRRSGHSDNKKKPEEKNKKEETDMTRRRLMIVKSWDLTIDNCCVTTRVSYFDNMILIFYSLGLS